MGFINETELKKKQNVKKRNNKEKKIERRKEVINCNKPRDGRCNTGLSTVQYTTSNDNISV